MTKLHKARWLHVVDFCDLSLLLLILLKSWAMMTLQTSKLCPNWLCLSCLKTVKPPTVMAWPLTKSSLHFVLNNCLFILFFIRREFLTLFDSVILHLVPAVQKIQQNQQMMKSLDSELKQSVEEAPVCCCCPNVASSLSWLFQEKASILFHATANSRRITMHFVTEQKHCPVRFLFLHQHFDWCLWSHIWWSSFPADLKSSICQPNKRAHGASVFPMAAPWLCFAFLEWQCHHWFLIVKVSQLHKESKCWKNENFWSSTNSLWTQKECPPNAVWKLSISKLLKKCSGHNLHLWWPCLDCPSSSSSKKMSSTDWVSKWF